MNCRMDSRAVPIRSVPAGRFHFIKRAFLVCCLLPLSHCSEERVQVARYDPSRAWNGHTYFTSRSAQRIVGVDMDGSIFLNYAATDSVQVGMANGFEVEEDGTMVYILLGKPMMMR